MFQFISGPPLSFVIALQAKQKKIIGPWREQKILVCVETDTGSSVSCRSKIILGPYSPHSLHNSRLWQLCHNRETALVVNAMCCVRHELLCLSPANWMRGDCGQVGLLQLQSVHELEAGQPRRQRVTLDLRQHGSVLSDVTRQEPAVRVNAGCCSIRTSDVIDVREQYNADGTALRSVLDL